MFELPIMNAFATAAMMTLGLALTALLFGFVFALLFCAGEMSKHRWLSVPVSIAVTVVRGVPEILVVMFVYYGSTQALFLLTDDYVEVSPFWSGVTALALLFAGYASQTLRAAINAVPSSQMAACRALGMSPLYSFFRIVLPQAWRFALPGLGNQWMVLLKDTALVSLIGVTELMKQASLTSATSYEPFTYYALSAMIYLLITLLSQQLMKYLRHRAAHYDRQAEA
ncbi:amino acid ABC transporter membrane protein 1 (PAAT family) [Sinobacterium caligoides]|uniref:Amino acid ABC transporter membrane protein 1 (PAAT family) n=1 Tax=Sinobacterium caligoides TaxID=933926 RepID=A0A3N2DFX9_9GAMM|nr:arginine ABC transporter permease ArtQ [Sinobacterium caligoides]ROR98706.1 amino acid ABC transporter membrane protein 1 (PAAT family) [Sinobacterium caligoides]